MDEFDNLRDYVLENLVEIFGKQSTNENDKISKLNEKNSTDSTQVNEILNKLNPEDSAVIKDYLLMKLELETEKMQYI